MLQTHQIEELISLVSALEKPALVERFMTYRANFPLDFTRDFLDEQPVDRLRHLFVALCLHTQQMPEIAASAA